MQEKNKKKKRKRRKETNELIREQCGERITNGELRKLETTWKGKDLFCTSEVKVK